MTERHFKPVQNILPPIQCTWSVGVFLERFYQDLSEKKITGIKCQKCKLTLVPPRKFCPECGKQLDKFTPIKTTGVLENYTVAYQDARGQRREKPLVIGLIKLDGATNAVFGEVRVSPPRELKLGMKLKAVFADQPGNTVESLSHFEPAGKN